MCHCWAWTPAMEGPRGLLMDWQGYAGALYTDAPHTPIHQQ